MEIDTEINIGTSTGTDTDHRSLNKTLPVQGHLKVPSFGHQFGFEMKFNG